MSSDTPSEVIPELHVFKEVRTPEMDDPIQAMRQALEDFPPYRDNEDVKAQYFDDDLIRFLRARNFELPKAIDMIKQECEWRSTFKPHLITAEDIEGESVTGKSRVSPYQDKYGRPVIVMHPYYENTKNYDKQLQLLAWELERCNKLMEGNVSRYAVVMKMEGVTMFNGPPGSVSKEVAKCLTSRYPERLGSALIIGAPAYFKVVYALVSPFLDAKTKSKIKFLPEKILPGTKEEETMVDILGENWRLITGIGAEQPDPRIAPGYDHETYWPRVVAHQEGGEFFFPLPTAEKAEEDIESVTENLTELQVTGEVATIIEKTNDDVDDDENDDDDFVDAE